MASISASKPGISFNLDGLRLSESSVRSRNGPLKLSIAPSNNLRCSRLQSDFKLPLLSISRRSTAPRAQGQDSIRDVTDQVRVEVSGTSGQDRVQDALQTAVKSAPEPIKSIAEDAVKGHSPAAKARGAVLHDFCLGIPYGILLAICALAWGVFVGSFKSAMFAVIVGVVIAVANVLSLNTWKKGQSSSFYTSISAGLSLSYALGEARRFSLSGALFPNGLTAAAGCFMAAFFIYNILAGGNPKSKKKAQAA